MKIFKYPCGWDGNRKQWWAVMPEGQIIRTDYVDDGTYKGYWVWAIVDPNAPNKIRTFSWIEPRKDDPTKFKNFYEMVYVENGMIKFAYDLWGDPIPNKRLHILGFKTGQEINVDVLTRKEGSYFYIGFAPLFIKTEITIYFFMRLEDK